MALPHASIGDLVNLRQHWPTAFKLPGDQTARLREVSAFGANPGRLRMFTYLPERLPRSAPLVVVLHGCGQTASGYEIGGGWSELADRHGFALLAPEQSSANNANTCFNWFLPQDATRGEGEAASIQAMILHMLAEHALDRRRVFITGLSAGGAMTAVMLATYPDLFAGGAIIAGLPYGSAHGMQDALPAMFHPTSRPAAEWGDLVRAASPHKGPWPIVSIWHGEADRTVAPQNAAESLKQWLDVHGLAAAEPRSDTVDAVAHSAWRDRFGRVAVETYLVPDLGHGTPINPAANEGGVGLAAPHIIAGPISSSWHIAQGWGLASRPPARVA